MTTIAYRDGIMAADSLCSGNNTRWGELEKITRGDGCIAGACGSATTAATFRHWVENILVSTEDPFGCDVADTEADGLLVTSDGVIWCWGGKPRMFRPDAPFTAIGSGAKIAIGAMAMGASAAKAVEIAAQFDVYTGGRITTLSLESPSRPKQEA